MPVIDLRRVVVASQAPLQLEANIHFPEGGYAVLGDAVAKEMRGILRSSVGA